MAKRRLTLLIPSEVHEKLRILSSVTGQSMTKIIVDCIDEKYVEYEKANQPQSSQKEPKFLYYK